MKHLANIITASRIAASFFLLFFKTLSPWFYVLYVYCGVSDMIDGTVARMTNSQSSFGAKLDSVSDVCFFAVCAIKLFGLIKNEKYITVFAAVVLVLKLFSIICGAFKYKRLVMPHTVLNKITGFLLFLVPLTLSFADIKYTAIPVCIFAFAAAVHELFCVLTGKRIEY